MAVAPLTGGAAVVPLQIDEHSPAQPARTRNALRSRAQGSSCRCFVIAPLAQKGGSTMTRRRDDEKAARLREENPRGRRAWRDSLDPYVNEFRTTDGGTVSVTTSESYVLGIRGDKEIMIDKTKGNTSWVKFSSKSERDGALSEIAGDHPVYDQDRTQLNPRAQFPRAQT